MASRSRASPPTWPRRRTSSPSSPPTAPPTAASTRWSTTPGSASARRWRRSRPSTSTCSSAVNLRALILGTREGLPLLREAGAEHGKALIVNTASIAGKVGQAWLSIYAATKAAVINFTQSTHREVGRRRHPVHGAGAGLRRHADDRVRQGPGAGRGDDPARRTSARRSASCCGPLPTATSRRSSSPGRARASTPLTRRAGDRGRHLAACPHRRLRRRRPRLPGDRAGTGAGGAWPRGRGRDLGGAAGRRSRAPGSASPPPRNTGCSRRPSRTPTTARHAAEAARALLPLLEELRPHVAVSDILTLAPALAAERAGVPLATLIPHIYPVVEPGLPFFAIGLRQPRTPLGRAVWRAGQRALDVGLEHGRRDLNLQRQRLGLAADRPLPRRHQPRPGAGRHLPAARVPAPLAGRGRGDRADDLRAAPPEDRAAARRRRRWSWSRPAPPTTPATTSSAPRWRRWPTSRCGSSPPPTGSSRRRPIEVPANAVLVDWLSYSQLMPAASLVDLPRRPRHRRPRPRRRHAGADLPDHRRHERDRDAGRLGRRRPLRSPGASAGRRRCAGRRGACSTSPPSPSAPARSPPGAGSTTAPSAAPSWSRQLALRRTRTPSTR